MKENMKIGLQISEQEYRELPEPSYSILSGVAKSGPTFLTTDKEDISDLDAIIIGSLVDSLVTEHKVPDNMVIVDTKPSNKALIVIKALADRPDLVEKVDLLSIKNIKQIIEECDKLGYYKSSISSTRIKYLKKYNKYAKALMMFGKEAMIVSSYQHKTAMSIAERVFLKFPFVKEPNILGQVKIIDEFRGLRIKCMLDFMQVDYENKIITPYDLKTGIGSHDVFFERGFLNWNYFLQASLYREVLTTHLSKDPIFKDFKIDNFRFLYCGRIDKLPVMYKVTDKWHEAGLKGFSYNNIKFDGVNSLIKDYEFYKEYPNNPYKRGFEMEEIPFDDSLCNINENG